MSERGMVRTLIFCSTTRYLVLGLASGLDGGILILHFKKNMTSSIGRCLSFTNMRYSLRYDQYQKG